MDAQLIWTKSSSKAFEKVINQPFSSIDKVTVLLHVFHEIHNAEVDSNFV